ncbi:MAG: 3-oxoacyl-ACP reductase FabG [Planctomycetes bacterium]|nr:3-oxoacyl-ACP reductase FabG [Planctomycetota bacterium]
MNTKRVLVTGASRGIGRATAVALARGGYEVVLNYRDREDAAQAVRAEIEAAGGKASTLRFDVADRAAARAAIEVELRERGAFWGLVLNAGVTADGPFAGMSEDAWDRVLTTNLDGFYNVVQPLVMPMVQLRAGGRIVVMTSISGQNGNRGQANYAASKAGLIAAAKSLAQELAKRNVTVNCVAPGLIETDMTAAIPRDEVLERIPLRRFGKPEEVASAVEYLFSAGAAYVTGQVLAVNGGMA